MIVPLHHMNMGTLNVRAAGDSLAGWNQMHVLAPQRRHLTHSQATTGQQSDKTGVPSRGRRRQERRQLICRRPWRPQIRRLRRHRSNSQSALPNDPWGTSPTAPPQGGLEQDRQNRSVDISHIGGVPEEAMDRSQRRSESRI
jgi:hypothetical protein